MRRSLRTLAVTAALTMMGGLLAAGTAVATVAAPTPSTPTAAVGDCHALTFDDINGRSNPRAKVDCATAHTALTIAVGTLPTGLTFDGDEDRLDAAVSATCGNALARTIGTNLLLFARSQYTWVWFQPTDEQIAAGARWYSCHLVVLEDSRLGALPHPAPKLRGKLPDAVAQCTTGALEDTTCADRHAYRATYSFYATGKATKRNVEKAAGRKCPKHVTGKKWLYSSWDVAGKRYIVICSTKTRH